MSEVPQPPPSPLPPASPPPASPPPSAPGTSAPGTSSSGTSELSSPEPSSSGQPPPELPSSGPSPARAGHAFDPTYGYGPDALLRVGAPPVPEGFARFWERRHARALAVDTRPELGEAEEERDGVRLHPVTYTSVGGVRLGGWVALPVAGPARHGFVIGHGYGGRDRPGPDVPLPLPGSAAIMPCVRGMPTRGTLPGIPGTADAHVLHGIGRRETYVLGDCVADLWCAASALLALVPGLREGGQGAGAAGGRLGYLGESFGGGLGALALPWDERFAAGQLTVPTFGNHPLRLTLECVGSGEAVRAYHRTHPEVLDVLRYFDAATAARLVRVPVLVAAALRDPAVPPPGQFAVYNALAGARELLTMSAGHQAHRDEERDRARLVRARSAFFGKWLGGGAG